MEHITPNKIRCSQSTTPCVRVSAVSSLLRSNKRVLRLSRCSEALPHTRGASPEAPPQGAKLTPPPRQPAAGGSF
eukprot:4576449-Amphidinium_carterae.1